MKCIYFHSKQVNRNDILWGLVELEIECEVPEFLIDLDDYDEEILDKVLDVLNNSKGLDFVMTQNFAPVIAVASNRLGIPYISWLYDVSLSSLYREEIYLDTNYIFTFDRAEIDRLAGLGVQNVHYGTLASNISLTSSISITEEDLYQYKSEISFVGQLYNDQSLNVLIDNMTDEMYGIFTQMVETLLFSWKKGDRFTPDIDKEVFDYFYNHSRMETISDKSIFPKRLLYANLFVMPVLAHIERVCCLEKLSEFAEVSLYTIPKDMGLVSDRIKRYQPVSYDEGQYKVFAASKINLNLTIPKIETGVVQRVFDIMAVGGLCMSNYREDAELLFEPDKEIVLFHSVDELIEKADYYLKHENEAYEIALNGYKKVRECYTYPIVLQKMIRQVLK